MYGIIPDRLRWNRGGGILEGATFSFTRRWNVFRVGPGAILKDNKRVYK